MNKQDLGFFSNTMSKIRHFWENEDFCHGSA
ncbi:hypothetical protein V3C99_016626 [Haemonchus contortus]